MAEPTMEERIESARRALFDGFEGLATEEARYILAAAFPELFSDPPTHELAPVGTLARLEAAEEPSWRDE